MARTQMRSCFAADRISNLPCDVINNILKYLPLRDTVRTCILSREWRYKWVNVPHLVFDANFRQNLRRNYNMESIIYEILLLHKGPMVEFTLEFADGFHFAINHWFHFLSNHRIEKLKLGFFSLRIHHVTPYHLFSFDDLTHFYLANAHLTPPSIFEGFGKLVSLDLVDVHTVPGELGKFISKCPMLEYLNLCRLQSTSGDFEIDAPNLKSFCFDGILRSICFQNTSLLEKISITLDAETSEEVFQELESNLIEFFGQVSSIKRLELNGGFLQFLGISEVPQNLPNSLNHLMVLDLFEVDSSIIDQVTCAVCLIRSLPNLQTLQFKFEVPCDRLLEPVSDYLKTQQKIELTLSHLEYVKIVEFSLLDEEWEFVKLILSAATALRKLEILIYWECVDAEARPFILTELKSLPRASSIAEIMIDDPPFSDYEHW